MKQRGVQTDPHVYSHSIYNTDATGERVVKKKNYNYIVKVK